MKLLHFLDERFEEVIGVLLLTVVVSLIFIGVVLRLSFNTGIPLQEELSECSMWWWFISERATECAARITSGS